MPSVRFLSKSKLVAFRQCPKRLWLEVHQPDLRQNSAATQAVFAIGHEVGAIAQRLFDPRGLGETIDLQTQGLEVALEKTRALVNARRPIFEAGFAAEGALAFADVMLPQVSSGSSGWRMIEVKSSTSVKPYHEDDVAIQSHIARAAGIRLQQVSIAHIDSAWVYPGGGDYRGFLVEVDLTTTAFSRQDEVRAWIAEAQDLVARPQAPEVAVGRQCHEPFDCGFLTTCRQGAPTHQFPVSWLPRIQTRALKTFIEEQCVGDMRDLPDHLLNALQRRVRDATLSDSAIFDASGARQALASYPLPAYFLDFETIQFAVPRWAGTRPFQMLPFQFSLHRLSANHSITHEAFLDLTGDDPAERFAHALARVCQEPIPVFVYNAGFEGARLSELAQRFTDLRDPLLDIKRRLVDLHPIARDHYYHPGQQGSWSIKKVLPTLAPDLDYSALSQVQDGSTAMQAYAEAIDAKTLSERKAQIERQLLAYCAMDTLAMVEIWRFFAGAPDARQLDRGQ
jgi:hypothetical protein